MKMMIGTILKSDPQAKGRVIYLWRVRRQGVDRGGGLTSNGSFD